MTDGVRASAPGKVVLSGEYAVLHGAPAVCMAVDRRAMVSIDATADEHHVVVAPGHVEEPRRFVVRDGVFGWLDSSDEFDLLERVWARCGVTQQGGLSLHLDSSAFLDTEQGCKTGIGSSAALAVALSAALAELSATNIDATAAAHEGHLDFQGGLGSGVDIATSSAGGLVEYLMHGRTVVQRAFPPGLECRLIWSGTPARTGVKLERLSRNGPKPSQEALVVASRNMAEAWASGARTPVLSMYQEYIAVLQEFSDDHDLGIFAAGHQALTEAAANEGMIYKPCGAGGGDIGILLSDSAELADHFVSASLPTEFRALELRRDDTGVEVTESSE